MSCVSRGILTGIVACSCLVSIPSFAEPLRGRLPDGRAFRTDAQGVQVVDYVAELELSIEALNRRIQGLESELEERAACNTSGNNGRSSVVERDILPKKSSDEKGCPEPIVIEKECPKPVVVEKTVEQKCPKAETIVVEKECPKVEPIVIEKTIEKKGCPSLEPVKCPANNSAEWQEKWQASNAQVMRLQDELAQAHQETQALRNQQQNVDKVVSKVVEVPSQSDKQEIASLKQQLVVARAEIEKYKGLGRYRTAQKDFTPSEIKVDHRASMGKPSAALVGVRGELQSEYNRLQGEIARRNNMYQRYLKSGNQIKFRLSPLRTRTRTIDSVRYGIQHENNLQALSALRAELKQIGSRVKDDIALMERLMHSAK